ncbi:MAG: acetyl/propionyl/methylcrotonyl-CoA carboxylase subunit alpha [Acidimicrobiia bacterium]
MTTGQPITKLLVANRGEIARRVFSTCRSMGIATVAVYSDSDREAPFVTEADAGVALGGATPAESYLRGEAIIEAARRSGADAVHPGYGFLAESPDFARSVIDAGLVWVGPSPAAIETMGSKLASKALMNEVGVPTIESVDLTGMESATVAKTAADIGYPLLVKASAGGGGKGMRIVTEPADLVDAVIGAGREALSAFGDETVFLERYLDAPRHIEIQVFADSHGTTVSLFERECSIQRRHQKIIEEAPSVAIDEETRAQMSEAAVAAAKAVDYVGAGTVEFLYQGGRFHFLEMNTRLQVEHAVTEMITGLDLVRLQLLVAMGEPLLPEAAQPSRRGHAIEARLYAEDAQADFLPVSGLLDRVRFPDLNGLRVDSGVEDGSVVSAHYDPLLAKVVAWAPTRTEAASLLARGLERAAIHGSVTNRDLLVRILRHPEFVSGDIDTHFLTRHDPAELGRPLIGRDEERAAAVAAAISAQVEHRQSARVLSSMPSGWRNVPSQPQLVSFSGAHGQIEVGYRFGRGGGLEVTGFDSARLVEAGADKVGIELDGILGWFQINRAGLVTYVDGPGGAARLVELARFPTTEMAEDPGSLHAPMPGTVIRVTVAAGDDVAEGQVLVVMEAMKMEHSLRAPHAGTVTTLHAKQGDQVAADEVLVVVGEP